MKAKKPKSYTNAIEEIENIIENIENNEIDIDKISDEINRATELFKYCKERLTKTEKDVENIINLIADK